ncbi:response regulator [Porticoccaceae bacterium LTM1]|nr:response regulator [Porticoccaceae bacterium LTM1]
MRILLVEDDLPLARGLERALVSEGYVVDVVNTGEGALFLLAESSPDMVILDIGLPDVDGLTVLKRLRPGKPTLPVLLLTARDSLDDKVAGLDGGADDYLTKPFEMPELIARLRVIERRATSQLNNCITLDDVTLDKEAHRVSKSEQVVELSGKEYSLLKVLMENAGKILSKEQLESKLYSWGEDVASNTVEVHVHHLRKKLGKTFIKNVRGIGYTISKS